MQLLLQFIFFIGSLILSFYIPGIFLCLFLPEKVRKNSSFLSWPIGYSFFILAAYISAWIRAPYLVIVLLGFIDLFILFKKRYEFIAFIDFGSWLFFLLILLGSLCFVGTSFLSALKIPGGLQFIGSVNATDGVMHLAFIKSQTYIFPPVFASFYGFTMKGYHYFYDFLLSRFALFYHFTPEDLYYRFFPFVISIFYGWSMYKFATLLTKKKIELFFIVFFAYFAQSFAFILSLFIKSVDAGNGMGVVQPLELILDPSTILGIGILLTGFFLLMQENKTFYLSLLTALVLGLLAELKVYMGIVGIGSLFIFSFLKNIKKEDRTFYNTVLVAVIFLTAITYFPNNYGVGGLLWHPFFLYDDFMKQSMFASWNWEIKMIIYTMHRNIPRLIFMNFLSVILLWILALGTRFVVILQAPRIIVRTFWKKDAFVLMFLMVSIPLLIASLFVQSVSIFDTKQFFWIPAVLLGIPSGIFYGKIVSKIPFYGKAILIAILIFCSVGSLIRDENIYVFNPQPMIISNDQLILVKEIQKYVSKQKFFVVLPYYTLDKYGNKIFQYNGGPIFSELTGLRTYYEFEYLAPEHIYTVERDKRKRQLESILLLGEKCSDKKVAQIMSSIGSNYMVSQSDFLCGPMPHLKKIDSRNGWTFWKVT